MRKNKPYQKMVKSYQKMVNYLNSTKNKLNMNPEKKIYETFYDLKQNKLYYNQIKEHTNLSHSSLQNVLKELVENKVLEEEKTKSNKFYKTKNKKLFELKFSEIAIKKFNNLNINIKIPLTNFLKEIPKEVYTIILFGSASKRQETKESDIDLLIVSNNKLDLEKNKKEAELTSKYPISIFHCNINQFQNNQDPIIIQAIKTGFPIYKEQNFYEETIK